MKKKQKRGILLLLGFSLMIQHTSVYGETAMLGETPHDCSSRVAEGCTMPLSVESSMLRVTRVTIHSRGTQRINFRACVVVDGEEQDCSLLLNEGVLSNGENGSYVPGSSDPFVDLIRVPEVIVTKYFNPSEKVAGVKQAMAEKLKATLRRLRI